MKIVYIANARIPTEKAHGFQICKMCEQLSLAGAEVELWVSKRKNHLKEDLFSYYNIKKNFKVKYIKSPDFIKFVRYLGPVAMWLQRIFFIINLKKISGLNVVVLTRDPEIVWWMNKYELKTVYENHDGLGSKRKLILYMVKNVDKLITTNRFIKRQFVAGGIPEHKILVAPHGVDFSIFDIDLNKERALTALKVDNNLRERILTKRVLLYTGNFRTMGEDKGINDIIKSLKFLEDNSVLFVAVGGNEEDIDFYKNLAAQYNMSDQVLFFSRQSQKNLALWQNVADILLMPFPDKIHYHKHMAPLKMFEYQVSGKPILASDLPSIKDVLNSNTAFFCQPDNPQDLAEKIKYILKNPVEARKRADNAYRQSFKYTWLGRAKNIIEFIKK